LFRNVHQADALALRRNINHSCLYCFIGLEDLKQNQSSDSERGTDQNLKCQNLFHYMIYKHSARNNVSCKLFENSNTFVICLVEEKNVLNKNV